MTRLRRDIDDLDDSLFGREEAQRRAEQRKEWVAEAARRTDALAAQDAKLRAEAKEHTLENNRRQIMGEYMHHGVAPPCVDGNGVPTIGLQLLLKMGWTIEYDIDGERALIAPPRPKEWSGYRDRDSLPEQENKKDWDR